MTAAILTPGTPALPVKALDFDGSNYLSQLNSAWGSYNRAKFAIACAIKLDALPASGLAGVITTKGVYGGTDTEYLLQVTSGGLLQFSGFKSGSGSFSVNGATVLSTGTYYTVHVNFDGANATEANRVKIYLDGVDDTDAQSGLSGTFSVKTTTDAVIVGNESAGNNGINGRVYQMAFFDGVNPAANRIYSGGIKQFASIAGVHSLLDVLGGVVTNDTILGTAWTNNGTVTASTEVP